MRARKNCIYVGSVTEPDWLFENDRIVSCTTVQAVALVGQEMSIDKFTPVVTDAYLNMASAHLYRSSDGAVIECADGSVYAVSVEYPVGTSELVNLPYGTPVWYYQDDAIIGKFYIDTVRRVARTKYQLNCISAIGLLDRPYDAGGFFVETTFGDVLSRLVCSGLHGDGTQIIGYSITDEVSNLPVSCYLPYDTKRNNLYRICFANGVNITQNPIGNPEFTFLYDDTAYATEIPDELIYNGGRVEYEQPYERVTVLEHTYTALTTESRVTLFDNSGGVAASEEEVIFSQAPIIVSTIESTGLLVHDVGENFAIVSGQGVLTGIPYLHTTHLVSRGNQQADENKTVSVNDCTAVNVLNSSNLLERLFAYYCPQDFIKNVSNSIVYRRLMRGNIESSPPKCGRVYSFTNPFGEKEAAFLSELNINASAINKGTCEWRAGYEPAGQAGLYHHYMILDKETFYRDGGTFFVPQEALDAGQIKVVLIGGGTGGYSGWPGENGEDATTYTDVESNADISAMWYGAEGGAGGAGGPGGAPGRVKIVTIEDPEEVYSYSIGDGGEGGAASGFIPDTVESLRAALKADEPENEYTDEELEAMIALEQTDWDGSPREGEPGMATSFDEYSTNDTDAYVPSGGVYEPISNRYFALPGNAGLPGGAGGARKVEEGGTFAWTTDGEDVTGPDGTVWRGGSTGAPLTSVDGLPEVRTIAYGGSGAGAAIGIDRATHEHINGGEDWETFWEVVEADGE